MSALGVLLKLALTGIASSRFYPGLAPEGAVPTAYLTYTHEGPPENTLGGAADLENQIVQVDSWAATYLEADSNARLVVTAMAAQADWASPSMFTSTNINYGYFGVDPAVMRHRVSMEFSVWYRP